MEICRQIRTTLGRTNTPVPAELDALLTRIDELGAAGPCDDAACDALQLAICQYLDAVAQRRRLVGHAIGRTLAPPLADVVTAVLDEPAPGACRLEIDAGDDLTDPLDRFPVSLRHVDPPSFIKHCGGSHFVGHFCRSGVLRGA